MPIQIEEMTSEVTAVDGDLPLTDAQIEKFVKLVIKKLQDKERDARQTREATVLRRQSAPQWRVEE